MEKEVLKTWFFQQQPGEVWDYLTKPELIEQWLMKCDFEPVTGHKFQFINKGKIDAFCQVLEIVPFKLLSYSWRKGVSENEITVDSVVTWTLTEKNGGTELHLLHNGFTKIEDAVAHSNGWDYCMNRMIAHINPAPETTGMPESNGHSITIEVGQSPEVVFDCITDVSKWWSIDFAGASKNLGDEFVICHTGAHYSRQKLIELVPNKKVVWLVTESELDWLEKDKHEWTNTKMIFDITHKGDKTVIHFTHEGLVPGKECFVRCQQGWNMVIKERLVNFISEGKTI